MIEWEPPDQFIGTAAAIASLAAAGVGAGASIYAAKSQSGAARDAANAQVTAANKSADLQAKANADALAFQKEQAAAEQARFEATQRANYGQYVARENRLSDFGSALGLAPRNTPAYQDTTQSGDSQGAVATGVDPKVGAFIQQWQSSHAPSEGIAPLAEAIAKQFPGVSRYMYGATPSNNELVIGGQKYKVLGGEGTPAAYWYQPGMNDSPGGGAGVRYPSSFTTMPIAGAQPRVLTPALMAPRVNSFGAM